MCLNPSSPIMRQITLLSRFRFSFLLVYFCKHRIMPFLIPSAASCYGVRNVVVTAFPYESAFFPHKYKNIQLIIIVLSFFKVERKTSCANKCFHLSCLPFLLLKVFLV